MVPNIINLKIAMKPSPSFGVKVLSALTKITIEKAKVTKSHIIISKIIRLKQDFLVGLLFIRKY